MEKSSDSREILRGVFDFVTCQRGDGSFYGNGGAQCRKGVEASKEELAKLSKSGVVSKEVADFCSGNAQTLIDHYQVDPAKTAEIKEEWNRQTEEVLQRIKDDKLTPEEVEGIIVKGLQHDITQSEFVIIGMEEAGVTGTFENRLAGKIAAQKMIKEGFDKDLVIAQSPIHEGANFITEGTVRSGYIVDATKIATNISGREVSRQETMGTFFGGRKVGTIEMMGLDSQNVGAASTDASRSMYGVLAKSNRPEIAKYGSRKYVEGNFTKARADFVRSQLQEAAANPNFKGALAMPGAGPKWKSFKSGLIDPMVSSGTKVYSTPQTITLKNGKTQKIDMLTMEVSPGKYMVAGAFFPGYGRSSSNIPQAYNNAIKQVQSGSAKPYTPAPPRARRGSSKQTASKTQPRPKKNAAPQKKAPSKANQASTRDRQIQALRFQVNQMRARGMSDAQIRASLRKSAGSLLSQVV